MITFKQYLAEKAMNPTTYSKTLERLADAKLGFELEMWVPEESDLLVVSDEKYIGDFKKTAAEAKKSLEDYLGVDVVVGESDTKWKIVPDGSVQGEDNGVGIEVVSPPLHVEDGLDDLRSCFKWMSRHEVQTNSTTGIHLNISIPGLKEKLDPLKLILFMGEDHVLKTYQREANNYARKHVDDVMAALQNVNTLPKNLISLRRMALDVLKREKYRTVNLSKLDQGYLEFRTAGNEGYHRKYSQIAADVGRFLTVLELSCDPEAEKKNYFKKIAKLFHAGSEARIKARPMPFDSDASDKPGSLEALIGGLSVSNLKEYGRANVAANSRITPERVGERLASIMAALGKDIDESKVEIPTKTVAEFKLLFSKIQKNFPDVSSLIRGGARSQVQLDNIKAFKKTFNIK